MQLENILQELAFHGQQRYVRKHAFAGLATGLYTGARLPAHMKHLAERKHQLEDALNEASVRDLSGKIAHEETQTRTAAFDLGLTNLLSAPLHGAASGISRTFERAIHPQEFGERKDPFHLLGQSAIQGFGRQMGASGANLLTDMMSKAVNAATHAGDPHTRAAILGELKKSDTVLSGADDKTLMESYHTMARFAPVLSTDKNAVRSFLRQAVMSGAGPDYMSIKLLAESERAVNGERDRR